MATDGPIFPASAADRKGTAPGGGAEIRRMVRRTLEESPDAVFWVEDGGGVLHANMAARARFLPPGEGAAAPRIFDIDAGCDAARWPGLRERLKNLRGGLYDTRFLSREGVVPVEVACLPVAFEGRQLLALFVRDVSLCKRAEEASRESAARLRAVAMALPDLVFVLDEDGRHLDVLTAQEDLLCASADEIRGRLLHDIFERPLADRFLELTRDTIRRGAPGVIEYELPIAGRTRFFEARTAPLNQQIDGRRCLVWIARDITDGKLAERLHSQNVYLQEEIKAELNYGEIVGASAAMRTVFENIRLVADSDATVLLLGETGTGKELVARALHRSGSRRDNPLIKVNCGALPASLVESELFGHEKGAFTGAVEQKKGRFELAHQGTIFLDEVGELPPEIQIKLLRVLQDQEFERVGGTRTVRVNARVIAATNRDLSRLVREGGFRVDLYYRLNIFPIRLPPLRERREDIPPLVHHFIAAFSARMGKRIEGIEREALGKLCAWDWPGNVRELANVIERAVILCRGGILEKGHISGMHEAPVEPDRFPSLEEMERRHIRDALERAGGVLSGPRGAAALLDVNRSTLWSRMQKLGIRIDRKVSAR